MKKGLLITSGVLALIAVVAFSAVLFIGGDEHQPIDAQQSTNTTQSFEEWTASWLAAEEAQKHTTVLFTTTTAAETTTTNRSWFTAYMGSVTVPSWTTADTEATTTTTATAGKTTRTLTQAERDMVYSGVYDIVMEAYTQYRAIQLEYIAELDGKIAKQEAQKDALYAGYKEEATKYSTESAKAALYNAYQNNIASINRTIAELEAEKKNAQAALTQSENELEAVIQAKYLAAVEELQQSTLS